MLLERLFDLQKNLDHLFRSDLNSSATFARGLFPAVNIFEKNDSLLLRAEVPGLTKDQIKIELKDNTLSLSGERKEHQQKNVGSYHRKERNFGLFRRQIGLPYRVDPEKVVATLANGLLSIKLERAEDSKARFVSIQ